MTIQRFNRNLFLYATSMKRSINIQAFQEKIFDLLIIGGGITGAGIFHEAASRGYACLLLEKGDFASGTSSKSAKLIHGGIRYLKYGKIGMIKESLEERNHLLKKYPHLVKPLPFLFPVYDSTFKYRVGMAIYHFLSNEETLPEYRYIEPDEIVRIFPSINPDGLKGGFVYFDAITNDARLCNEVICDAQKIAGNHAINYCDVLSLTKNNQHAAIKARDYIENVDRTFQARCIINASGVWTDDVLKRVAQKQTSFTAPSKGVHLVLSKKRFPCEHAIVIPSYADDNRLNYSVPWENDSVIIGTTDTDYTGNPDHPLSDEKDVEYLLHSLQKFAPSLCITQHDILHIYSGLRPMYNDAAPSYERSRDYRVWWETENILNILGGKLTSFHSMAESVIEELMKKFPCTNTPEKTHPSGSPAVLTGLPVSFVERVHERFLEKAPELFSVARENKNYTELLHPDFPATVAEVIYYIRNMQCCHLDDLLGRRLSFTYVLSGWKDKDAVISKVAGIMQSELGWSNEQYNDEVNNYITLLETSLRPLPKEEQSHSGSSQIRISKC